MRPIKLSMTAFGPFIDTQVIDFGAFGESPLFLINGATGSGKTTILDAICFALYGQTTGKEREAVQMRCDYADDKTLTEVEFVFELAGKCYRILRIPEQFRAKAKGEGTTRQSAKAELWLQQGDQEKVLVPQKVSEATREIEILTGLRVDQFRQVMVLPQGQFRRLLMADSKDREQIFSQLFETHVYKQIEDKLKTLAKNIQLKVQKLNDNRQGVLQSVDVENTEALEGAIQGLMPECSTAKAAKQENESKYFQAIKHLDAARVLAQEFKRLEQQQEHLKTFENQRDEIEVQRQRYQRAQLAQKISPIFSDLVRCREEVASASAQLDKAQQNDLSAKAILSQAHKALEANKEHQKELDKQKTERTVLESYQVRASQLQKAQDVLDKTQLEFQASEQQLEIARRDSHTKADQLEQSESDKTKLERVLNNTNDLRFEHQALSEKIDKKTRYEALLVSKAALLPDNARIEKHGESRAKDLAQKQVIMQKIELAWHQGQAAMLAEQLDDGSACPVCGSTEHPQPAKSDKALPDRHDRKKAQQAVDEARARLQATREEYTNIKTQLKGLTTQINEQLKIIGSLANTSLDDLMRELSLFNDKIQLRDGQQQQLEQLGKTINSLKQQQQLSGENFENLNQAHALLNADLQAHRATASSAKNELPAQYRKPGQVGKAMSAIEAGIQQLEQQILHAQQSHAESSKNNAEAKAILAESKKVSQQTEKRQTTSQQIWADAIQESLFEDELDYKQAHVDEAQIRIIKQQLKEYDERYQQAQGALESQQASLKDKHMPDIENLQSQVDLDTKDKRQAEEIWRQLDKQLSKLTGAENTLQKIAKKQKSEENEYRTIGTLSDVANGMTGNKISLQRFVLSVLLDDVLIEASHRLKVMSKGRYRLLRKEDRAKGNKASGLELEVDDSYTGKVRAVSTLSGGESFMASLSLALGLSDVVQAYAGGIRLDTLFIDEGFGSLDTDSLDLAIRILTDLRDTGRMVGIISHVSELKEQISMRLEVLGGRRGSTIQMIH